MTVKVIEVLKISSAWNLCDATGTTTAELLAILDDVRSEQDAEDGKASH